MARINSGPSTTQRPSTTNRSNTMSPTANKSLMLSAALFWGLLLLASLAAPTPDDDDDDDDKPLLVRERAADTPTASPVCAYTLCAYGSYCVEQNGRAACKCPPICMTFVAEKPICGSDGVTYAGLCAMEHYACLKRQNVHKVSDGECAQKPTNCTKG